MGQDSTDRTALVPQSAPEGSASEARSLAERGGVRGPRAAPGPAPVGSGPRRPAIAPAGDIDRTEALLLPPSAPKGAAVLPPSSASSAPERFTPAGAIIEQIRLDDVARAAAEQAPTEPSRTPSGSQRVVARQPRSLRPRAPEAGSHASARGRAPRSPVSTEPVLADPAEWGQSGDPRERAAEARARPAPMRAPSVVQAERLRAIADAATRLESPPPGAGRLPPPDASTRLEPPPSGVLAAAAAARAATSDAPPSADTPAVSIPAEDTRLAAPPSERRRVPGDARLDATLDLGPLARAASSVPSERPRWAWLGWLALVGGAVAIGFALAAWWSAG